MTRDTGASAAQTGLSSLRDQAPPGLAHTALIPSAATCATCAHIGRIYWGDDDRRIHHCGKSDERRRDNFQPSGDFANDFMSEFRRFFDASADQKACRYYEERPPLDQETVALLGTIASAGTAVFGFWSRENALCCKMRGKFVEEDLYPRDPTKGERYWKLSAVGRAVLAKARGEQA